MKILVMACLIALLPAFNALASELDLNANIDGNYFYGHARDSLLNPGNTVDVGRNRLDLKVEPVLKYIAKPITAYLDLRYFLNPPFFFDEERAFPNASNHIFLDEAKIVFNIEENASLTLGRQRFFWGPGFIKNPINVLNPRSDFRNSFFRMEEKSGVSGISGSVYSEKMTITLAVIPNVFKEKYSQAYTLDEESTEKVITALKVDTVLLNSDFTFLLSSQGYKPKFGFAFSTIFKDFEIHGESLLQRGRERRLINPNSFQDPADESFTDSGRFFGQYLIGIRYRSTSSHDFLVEYYRDDSGLNGRETDVFISLFRDPRFLGVGNRFFFANNLRRDYLFFRIGLSDTPSKFSHELLAIWNIDDMSFLIGVGSEYKISEKVSAYINFRSLNGRRESEFGMMPNNYTLSSGIKVSFL